MTSEGEVNIQPILGKLALHFILDCLHLKFTSGLGLDVLHVLIIGTIPKTCCSQ